jgi:hypothetical protein
VLHIPRSTLAGLNPAFLEGSNPERQEEKLVKYSMFLRAPVFCALLLMGGTASAQPANDMRCLLVSNLFAKSGKEPKAKRVGEVAAYFYLGRIDGRVSSDQLRTAMREQQKTVTAENAGAVMAACARRMEASARSVQAVGRQLAPSK